MFKKPINVKYFIKFKFYYLKQDKSKDKLHNITTNKPKRDPLIISGKMKNIMDTYGCVGKVDKEK